MITIISTMGVKPDRPPTGNPGRHLFSHLLSGASSPETSRLVATRVGLHGPIEDGLIGRHDGSRDPTRHRRGLADRVGEAHRRPRADRARRRPRRRARAGRPGRRAGAVAGVGRPAQPGRLAHGHREASRDRSAARRTMLDRKHEEIARELEAERAAGRAGSRRRPRRRHRRRPAAAGLHRLPSGPLDRGARGAHAPPARRPDDRRDRAGLPRPGADDRAAHRAGQAHAGRGARPVRGPARRRARRPPVVGARGDLPRLQRGLLGDRRRRLDAAGALRGRTAPRAHPGRADPDGAGGPRPGGAHGDPGIAIERARRARRENRSCSSIRTAPGGTTS